MSAERDIRVAVRMKRDSSTIGVRLAQVEDAPSIADLLYKAFAQYEVLYTPEAFAATTPSADQLRARWAEGPIWVAIQDGEPVGTVAAMLRGPDLYIRSMAVSPAAQGRGAANMLLERVERFAETEGSRRLVLSTTPFLRNAIRLYEKSGFRWTGIGPYSLHGTPLFTMEKFVRS